MLQIAFDLVEAKCFVEAMAQGTVDMMVAKNEGLDNAEPRTPRSTTPTSFRQWCEEVLKPAVLQLAERNVSLRVLQERKIYASHWQHYSHPKRIFDSFRELLQLIDGMGLVGDDIQVR
jgi:hypothetical protein